MFNNFFFLLAIRSNGMLFRSCAFAYAYNFFCDFLRRISFKTIENKNILYSICFQFSYVIKLSLLLFAEKIL